MAKLESDTTANFMPLSRFIAVLHAGKSFLLPGELVVMSEASAEVSFPV